MAALCATSCTTTADVEIDTPVLTDKFEQAARDYDVPVDLLKAIAYVETRWNHVEGEDHELGRVAGAGVFGLWGDNLDRGAAAAQLDVEVVRTKRAANIAAAAARLAELADARGISGGDLLAYKPVIADFAQTTDDEARVAYVDDVIRVLATGATSVDEDGSVIAVIEPHTEIGMPETTVIAGAGTDFPDAIWRASPNFASRGTHKVSLVVIHTCEGAYAGCWGWLKNPSSGVSAHYVVNESGSEVTQLVKEASRAYHISAAYECSRAGGQQCNKNGVGTNYFSVGIEHGGFGSQKSWSSGLIEKSARLTCDITKRHGVVRDRNHIVAHGQLQPWNRSDPGPNWPWSHYIDRVKSYCGDGGGGQTPPPPNSSLIIDSNNANNDQTKGRVELTGTWTASTNVSGYYGSGYYAANAAQTSAPATFWFNMPAAGTKTIDAWWTAGSDRSGAAPFIAFNASGTEVGRATVSQKTNGSQWVTLGTWNFSAGWNKVVLSRWTTAGTVVIADAVRVR
jgi:hypothetical protein